MAKFISSVVTISVTPNDLDSYYYALNHLVMYYAEGHEPEDRKLEDYYRKKRDDVWAIQKEANKEEQ